MAKVIIYNVIIDVISQIIIKYPGYPLRTFKDRLLKLNDPLIILLLA